MTTAPGLARTLTTLQLFLVALGGNRTVESYVAGRYPRLNDLQYQLEQNRSVHPGEELMAPS